MELARIPHNSGVFPAGTCRKTLGTWTEYSRPEFTVSETLLNRPYPTGNDSELYQHEHQQKINMRFLQETSIIQTLHAFFRTSLACSLTGSMWIFMISDTFRKEEQRAHGTIQDSIGRHAAPVLRFQDANTNWTAPARYSRVLPYPAHRSRLQPSPTNRP